MEGKGRGAVMERRVRADSVHTSRRKETGALKKTSRSLSQYFSDPHLPNYPINTCS